MSKQIPIMFTGVMVRAILENRKGQTRRVLKVSRKLKSKGWEYPLPSSGRLVLRDGYAWDDSPGRKKPISDYLYKPGDILWVKEGWAPALIVGNKVSIAYRADGEEMNADTSVEVELEGADLRAAWMHLDKGGWRNPRFMPRWASRITLEVTGARIERLQDISEEDAKAEGLHCEETDVGTLYWHSKASDWSKDYRCVFQDLWNSIYPTGPKSWEANPWVVVSEFKKANKSAEG